MKVVLEKYFETIRMLFLEIGIKSITMDDICGKLGISKKTLYKEYTDKTELVNEVFRKDFYDFQARLMEAQRNCPDTIAETCILFKLIAEKQNSLSLATLYDLRKYYHQLGEEIFQLMDHLILETLTDIINRGISEKNFQEGIEPGKIAAIVSFIFNSVIMQPLNNNNSTSVSLSDNSVLEYHFKSICTPKGLKLWEAIKGSKNAV
jgi:AcrR family transcriptional regulator